MLIKKLYNRFSSNLALKSVSIFTTINFLTKGISFLLLFVYTRPQFISPEENGLLSLFSSSLLLLMPFVSLGILFSTSTDIFKLKNGEFNNYFTTAMTLPVFFFIIFSLIFYFLRDLFKLHFHFPYVVTFLIPLTTFLIYINDLLVGLFRDKGELRKFTGIGIAKIVMEYGLSVVLVIFVSMRWQGRLTGIFVSYILLGFYAFWYFNKCGYLSGRFQIKYLRDELIYAIPIVVMQISIFSLNTGDKFILARLSENNEEVGVYSVASTFGSIIIIFCTAYLTYLFPVIYKILTASTIDYYLIKKKFVRYFILMATVSSLLILVVPFVYTHLINHKYNKATKYFYLLSIGYFIWSITYFFYSYLFYYKQKKKILLISLLIIPIAFLNVYYFVANYGAKGAAIGILISNLCALIITLVVVRSYVFKIFTSNKCD